ncbi:MAG TPA: ABC transporter permease subunit [Thermoflexia bacterium]|nr:ABC transporter permease subunit [Thermoflexia bacterium]
MATVLAGLQEGLRLLLSGDPYLWDIILRTGQVTGAALVVGSLLGIPLGALLGLTRFPGRRLVQTLIYTGMGLPPVLAGLAIYLLLSRNGILGPLDLPWIPKLFTPEAMVLAQVLIATPLIAGFTMAAVAGVDPDLRRQVEALGATRLQVAWAVLREARLGVLVSLVAGLGSILSEVGAVMLVGGNIEGSTRVLTTAILLETRRGNFDLAIGLGVVLLGLSFLVNLGATQLQGKGR